MGLCSSLDCIATGQDLSLLPEEIDGSFTDSSKQGHLSSWTFSSLWSCPAGGEKWVIFAMEASGEPVPRGWHRRVGAGQLDITGRA